MGGMVYEHSLWHAVWRPGLQGLASLFYGILPVGDSCMGDTTMFFRLILLKYYAAIGVTFITLWISQMAGILQATFSNAFPSRKLLCMIDILLEFLVKGYIDNKAALVW